VDPAGGYDFDRFTEPAGGDEFFVVLTLSGGGTRAAAFAYGVLEALRDLPSGKPGKSLLDEVDLMSTVSGGSFTGAYYALFGPQTFTDFKDRFLYRNIQGELFARLASPINWVRLASPCFSRIDMAAELYDETLFASQTFADLAFRGRRPFLVINATNLYQGARFEFTSRQFEDLGSDLLTYPVARAVAASSAFPFLLAPLTLVNHPTTAGQAPVAEDTAALEDYWRNRRRYQAAAERRLLTDKTGHPYVHLMDGGIADNLGLRAVYDLYLRGDIRQRINNGQIKRLLVIVVNARVAPPEDFDRTASPPDLATVAYKTCTLAMDNYSFETVEVFRDALRERLRAQQDLDKCQAILDARGAGEPRLPSLAGRGMKLHVAEVSFGNIADAEERQYFNLLPTSFTLSRDEVDALVALGKRLVLEHPELQELWRELGTGATGRP
jgi:predicted acylesterase/phospholipase RssA/uncharacterized tellurite resistance protein B-like protein